MGGERTGKLAGLGTPAIPLGSNRQLGPREGIGEKASWRVEARENKMFG
jgi:hypothetical protein